MSKALQSALEAVRRMSSGGEIDPVVWLIVLDDILRSTTSRSGEEAEGEDAGRARN